jgi:probable O-glycosylation ligase (exosortase A-associated)
MRDAILFILIFGSLPFILARPYIGVLVASWLGYMNPHRFAWGAAYNFPFVMVVALVTMAALAITTQRRAIPFSSLILTWILFIFWMTFVAKLFAFDPIYADYEWGRTMKIQLMTFVTILLIYKKEHILAFVWVIVLSLGFFGVKGGVFGLLTGGAHRVYGPPGSFIEDNNAIGLAMIVVIPLMHFLFHHVQKRWQQIAMLGTMMLTGVAILSTHSRGAMLGVVAMLGVLAWRSKRRSIFIAMLPFIVIPLLIFMPESWHDRMASIANYQSDSSAMGRINAWYFALNSRVLSVWQCT